MADADRRAADSLPATLITGAATRIGSAIARDLAAKGAPVAVHYNSSREAAEDTVAAIRDGGGTAIAVGANLMDEDALRHLIPDAAERLGVPIGLLINNASVFEKDAVGSLSRDLFDRHFAVHATAPALLADSMVANLPADRDGLIVNMIDQRVWRLTPNFVSYTASKVALWGLTQTLAQAFAETTGGRVRVNAIGPGPTLANARQHAGDFQKQVDAVPLKRGPQLEAFAQTIIYFWRMRSLTGQMIALDGGQHLAWETPDVAGINE